MNSNSGYMNEHQTELRKAVEEQLDLILKMEAERKALKKHNKLLTQQIKTANDVMNKYRVQTAQFSTNTQQYEKQEPSEIQIEETFKIQQKKPQIAYMDQSIQVDQENNSTLANCSKLIEAQSFLKALDESQAKDISQFDKKTEEQTQIKTNKKSESNNSKQQISNQIVKMSKQINSLKRQLKETLQKQTLKDKEIRELKKCLETKNQALQKTRKDFNDLSTLMNTDKFKSVRQLEQEVMSLRTKLAQNQSSGKLKKTLEEVITEYDEYKKVMQKRWDILISQLAEKQRENQQLKQNHKRMSKKLESLN